MPTTKRLTHHAALIYVMVTMAAVDRSMTDHELKRIGQIVSYLPVFDDFDINLLVVTAEDCGKVLASADGLPRLLTLIADALPENLRETAYAVAVEIAAVDRNVGQEELRFLEMLGERLKLSKLVVAAIERGARARHAIAI
jgi:tellurite resistance protein